MQQRKVSYTVIIMKEVINSYFNGISKIGIILIVLATLFLFTNLFTEFYDTPKFLVLLVVTGALLILSCAKFTVAGKVTLIRTPLDLPLILLLAVAIVSTLLTQSQYVSLLGNQLKLHGSLVSLATYVIFYLAVVNSLKIKEVKWVLLALTWGGAVLSVLTLFFYWSPYWGIKILPAPFQAVSFTPTGGSFSTAAILSLLVPILASKIISGGNSPWQILNSLFLALFGVTIALTGSLATWIAAGFGFGATVFTGLPVTQINQISKIKPTVLIALIASTVIVVLSIVLSFTPPIEGVKNPFYAQAQSFPREIQIPFVASWKISVSSFRDTPFWGSGPSTYTFDFTNYKPIDINALKIWNLRFDSAFNEYLQVLATLGGIGFWALLSLTALFVSSAYPLLTGRANEVSEQGINKSLAISGLTFFILLLFHPSTLPLWVIGLLILASFCVSNLSSATDSWSSAIASNKFFPREVKQVLLGITGSPSLPSSTQIIRVEALPSVLLVIALTLSLFAFFFTGKFALADYHHKLALNAVSANQGVVAYNELIAAEKLNPLSDLYRTDLAQVNFALANAIALAKGPTQSSPQGSLTDQDKQNIQVLLQQSINEGRTAVTLSPRSAVNWEILPLLYRQISGVAQNALVFALDSYGRAIFQDPLNPVLRLNVGGTYYAIKNYDLAIRFFTDSINLKPDFANGYYNLSVALRDKGDLGSAQIAAEKVLTLVEAGSQDYKVATDYLADLKNRIGSGSAQQSTIPPAAESRGALEKKELPKVVNVGNPPEKIATPPAVPKPTPTPNP